MSIFSKKQFFLKKKQNKIPKNGQSQPLWNWISVGGIVMSIMSEAWRGDQPTTLIRKSATNTNLQVRCIYAPAAMTDFRFHTVRVSINPSLFLLVFSPCRVDKQERFRHEIINWHRDHRTIGFGCFKISLYSEKMRVLLLARENLRGGFECENFSYKKYF